LQSESLRPSFSFLAQANPTLSKGFVMPVTSKTSAPGHRERITAAESAANFDDLPASAFVSLRTVATIQEASHSTIWRRVKDGTLPKPHKLGPNTTRWNVGELRECIARVMEGASHDPK
jgi:predicted DNA-binding transcriptional regulator AlpA